MRDEIIIAFMLASGGALLAGLSGSVVLFSTTICLAIGLGFGLAHLSGLGRAKVSLTILFTTSALTLLFAAAAMLHDSDRPLRVVLGFPIQTMLFVWVIWPLGAVLCALHALTFDELILPEEKVDEILDEFGGREGDD